MERRSIRVPGYNYAEQGWYFVTICTACRIPLFGRVERDGKMRLSRFGYVAKREWQHAVRLRKNVHPDAFMIMPDHVHIIVNVRNIRRGLPLASPNKPPHHIVPMPRIGCPNKSPSIIAPMSSIIHDDARLTDVVSPRATGACLVEGMPEACPYKTTRRFGSPVSQSLSMIIGQYKSAVTKHLVIMRRSRNSIWQRNYYERIIRNEYELQCAREYIQQNPERWEIRRGTPLACPNKK
jgi:putative transposase